MSEHVLDLVRVAAPVRVGAPIRVWSFVIAGIAALIALSGVTGAQVATDPEEVETQILQELEEGAALVGLAAFREVLESGTYLVGPGDRFLVAVSGAEKPIISEVLAEGGLYIPKVGLVQVGNLRLKQVHAAVRDSVAKKFKRGHVVIQLRQPRRFPVAVVGLVAEPGLAVSSGVERVSSVLLKRGGLLENEASHRNIRVFKETDLKEGEAEMISLGQVGSLSSELLARSHRVDLMTFGMTGRSRFNPFLEDGDIVLVPPPAGQVGVFGGVQRPGFYELVAGDRISDAMRLAMGLLPQHDPENVVLFRFGEDMRSMQTLDIDLEAILAGQTEADWPLQAGDWLNFREIKGYQEESTVSVEGEVNRPGYYVLPEGGMRVVDLIHLAGGLTKDAALGEARLISSQQAKEEERDPEIDRIRTVAVADRAEHDNQYFIMKSRERPGKMVVDFIALINEGDSTQNLKLQAGDQVFIPKQRGNVIVSGQAANPGAIPFNPDYSVVDYIDKAGGYGWRANTKGVLVIRARTGETKKAEEVDSIEPGDRIWIKEKPERDYWAIFTETISAVGQVTTVVLLVLNLTTQ
jgi:polysaccharide biosynthesis/export protein